MLVDSFCEIDDFCKLFEQNSKMKLIGNEKKVGKRRQLTTSEILTISIFSPIRI